ncbi:autotransporter assembly complex family protein [Jannaschia sp. W003]|uniref:autotransporter assembly complex protein TamA n=1 Tax=Jannaschia sp. W003 TaxID=2867012 RepID=UPI0021A66C27|nr:autotransporter assembly complex family protein [Jannaschia sp. W003]UWQ22452.1 autotransporter assembly complex protein TamA [Jannaschia sp. W003]
MQRTLAAGLLGFLAAVAPGAGARADLLFQLAVDDDLSDALRGASLLLQTYEETPAPARREVVAAAQADYRRLLAVLWESGRFGPEISITLDGVEAAELPAVSAEEGVGRVVVRVEPGPEYRFGRTEIAPLAPGTEIPEGFAAGEPAGTEILRTTARVGVEAWRAIGHAKADVGGQDIVADHAADQLSVAIRLAPGPRLRYGPTAVNGEERVLERQIRRIADLRAGQVYDPDQIEAAASRLQRTGAFRSVSITEADAIGPGDTLPLVIDVIEQLPRRFGFGAEIGSTEGATLSAFWLHRNLTGYADSLRVEGEVADIGGDGGGIDYGLSLAYARPAVFNPETDLVVGVEVERLDQPDFVSDRFEIGAAARRIASEEFSYSYGVSYTYSKTTDAFGTREFSILSLPLAAAYDRRDDPLNPADGYYVEAGLKPFQGFQTAGAGARFTADLRGYQGFGGEDADRTVLAARVQLGAVFGPDLDEIPPEWLFFSGGGGTVRGQPFQDLAVELPSGRRTGGRSFLGTSGEVRQRVTDKIGAVAFADAGWISEGTGFADGDYHVGAGLGVRYDTGIGPIRVDVGVPVSGPNDNGGVEIYIGIGQAF